MTLALSRPLSLTPQLSMFSSTNHIAHDGRYLVNQLKYKKHYEKEGRRSFHQLVPVNLIEMETIYVYFTHRNILHIVCTKTFEMTVPREIVSSK